MTDDDLRALWRSKGGKFHGPHIETGTMPEHQLLPFLRELMTLPQRAVLVTPDAIRSGTPNPPKKVWSTAQRLAGLLADMPSNAKSEPTSAALSREVGSTDGLCHTGDK